MKHFCLIVPLLLAIAASASPHRSDSLLPDHFVIGRHTFIDVGPPNDFYEVIVVQATSKGTLMRRVTLAPPGDACIQSATLEVASTVVNESVATLLADTNPCAIPEKELGRELKRCKDCVVFSGANVTMQVQCGTQSRVVRSDILDKDMFDSHADTPEHTSWTMQMLDRLDKALGPGVMEKPLFTFPEAEDAVSSDFDPEIMRNLREGNYDALFPEAPDKLEDLYLAAQKRPPVPTIRLISSSPIQPQEFALPKYPPIARLARVEGAVTFKVNIDSNGGTTNFTWITGNPYLRGSVQQAVREWKFPASAAGQQVDAAIKFAANCPPR